MVKRSAFLLMLNFPLYGSGEGEIGESTAKWVFAGFIVGCLIPFLLRKRVSNSWWLLAIVAASAALFSFLFGVIGFLYIIFNH